MDDPEVQKLLMRLKSAFEEEGSDEETIEIVLKCNESADLLDSFETDKFPGEWKINISFDMEEQEYSYYVSFAGDSEHLDEMKKYLENFLKEKDIVEYSLKCVF